jgi:ABC-type nitrate/sulfonate/bicarbonate transport system substrate-binding protein
VYLSTSFIGDELLDSGVKRVIEVVQQLRRLMMGWSYRDSTMGRLRRVVLLAVTFILFIAAIPALLPAATSSRADLKQLRISLPGIGSASYPLIMAQKMGYFRAEGYNAELIPMSGGLAVKTHMAGEVDFTSAGTVVAAIRGAKLKTLMAFIRELPYDLMAAPEIKRVEDLRGKKIAVSDRGSVTYIVARAILQGHGLEPDKDVNVLNMGRPDVRYQALMAGAVQAAIANFDGAGMLRSRGYHSVAKAAKYTKGFAGSLSATLDQLEKKPDEALRVVRATLKGTRAYLALPDEAIRITSEWSRITPYIAAKVHELMAAGALAPDGLLDRATMETVIADGQALSNTNRLTRLDEIFDFNLLQRANEELKSWRP